jgi:hypothetical protein
MVLVCDRQKEIQPLRETLGILLPELILQEHTNRIHADALCHPKLSIDKCRIEGCGLKHL